jgi:hypothetical protein
MAETREGTAPSLSVSKGGGSKLERLRSLYHLTCSVPVLGFPHNVTRLIASIASTSLRTRNIPT